MLNNNLRTLTLAQIDTLGRNTDFGTVAPQHLVGVNGTAQTERPPSDLYYNLNLNPFKNYIATLKGNFQLTPTLRLDVEPYFWYGYGTGGNRPGHWRKAAAAASGRHPRHQPRWRHAHTVMIYSSSHRHQTPGITFRLSTQLDNHKLMAGY
jgi:iron complex outermembrane receptor protein